MRLRFLIAFTLLSGSFVLIYPLPAFATNPSDIRGGVKNVPRVDGTEKHHILSQWAMSLAEIPEECWPLLNVLKAHHRQTRTDGSSRGASDARAAEESDLHSPANGATAEERLLKAFEINAAKFLQDMQAANVGATWMQEYQRAVNEARQALLRALLDLNCDPFGGPAPAAVYAGSTNNDPPPPPGSGGVAVATQNQQIKATGTGLGTAKTGIEYDLVLADSEQLARDPVCSRSPFIISADPAVVDSSGNLPSVSATIGTFYWESGGETDKVPPALGDAQICFVQTASSGSSAAFSARLKIYPTAVGTPVIYPPVQTAGADGKGTWDVAVPKGPTATTLRFCYGDSVCAPDINVAAGSGSTAFTYSHTFGGTFTYVAVATVVQTGAQSTALTVSWRGVSPPSIGGCGPSALAAGEASTPSPKTHSGDGNHHWLVAGDGVPTLGTDPSGGSPGVVGTGGAKFRNGPSPLVPGGAKVTSYLDMKDCNDGAGGNWVLKYSRSGVPTGNFCGENAIGTDTTVATLTSANGGTPWGANITSTDPGAGKGFLWEVVWGETPNGRAGKAAPPPTSAGAYETCVVGGSDLVLQAETIIYFDVV